MGQYYNTGKNTVTGVVNATVNTTLPAPNANQTIVTKTALGVSTGTVLHTVTAGKTFYCLGVLLSSTVAGKVTVAVDGTDKIGADVGLNFNAPFSGGIVFEAASGKQITVTTNAGANTAYATIWGYEQ